MVILCMCVIMLRLREPDKITIGRITKLIATSYEIICAAERSAPINAYLELLDHPARIILYALRELSANRNRTPYRKFTTLSCSNKAFI